MNYITESRFYFDPELRSRFRSGELCKEWRERYPEVFDDDDIRVVRTPEQKEYNFLEWLAAVLFFEATGFRSLVAKYGCKNHPKKLEILDRICRGKLRQLMCDDDEDGPGWPDLLLYKESPIKVLFCEVKGPGDKLRDVQHRRFRQLFEITGEPVRVLWLEELH